MKWAKEGIHVTYIWFRNHSFYWIAFLSETFFLKDLCILPHILWVKAKEEQQQGDWYPTHFELILKLYWATALWFAVRLAWGLCEGVQFRTIGMLNRCFVGCMLKRRQAQEKWVGVVERTGAYCQGSPEVHGYILPCGADSRLARDISITKYVWVHLWIRLRATRREVMVPFIVWESAAMLNKE